jgi:hypothetical protein
VISDDELYRIAGELEELFFNDIDGGKIIAKLRSVYTAGQLAAFAEAAGIALTMGYTSILNGPFDCAKAIDSRVEEMVKEMKNE